MSCWRHREGPVRIRDLRLTLRIGPPAPCRHMPAGSRRSESGAKPSGNLTGPHREGPPRIRDLRLSLRIGPPAPCRHVPAGSRRSESGAKPSGNLTVPAEMDPNGGQDFAVRGGGPGGPCYLASGRLAVPGGEGRRSHIAVALGSSLWESSVEFTASPAGEQELERA